jgi:hypothetical protein
MVSTGITGTSPDDYRDIIALPSCGEPASPWQASVSVVDLPASYTVEIRFLAYLQIIIYFYMRVPINAGTELKQKLDWY